MLLYSYKYVLMNINDIVFIELLSYCHFNINFIINL